MTLFLEAHCIHTVFTHCTPLDYVVQVILYQTSSPQKRALQAPNNTQRKDQADTCKLFKGLEQ